MPYGLSRRLSFGVRQRLGPRDPITQGLVLAVAPGVADGFDFSGKNHSLQAGSQLGRSATATGSTRTTLAANDALASMLSVTDAWVPTIAVTVLLRKRKQDTTARAAGSFGLTSGGTSDRCGAHLPYSDGAYYFDFGGSTVGATRVSVAGGTIDTLPHTFICTAGPRGMEIWRDGALLVTGAFSGSRSLGATPFGLGQHGTIRSDLEDWEAFSVWDRQLSTGEIAAVTANPLRLFRAPRRRVHSLATSTATQLGILRHALGSANGLATSNREFDFQPAILIRDVLGATVTTDNTTVVTATITSGAGALIGTVTKTAIAGVADFGANFRAGAVPWVTATAYALNDVVVATGPYGTQYYLCTVAHTSDASTQPSVGASWHSKWLIPNYVCNFLGINGIGTNTITYSAPGLTSVVEDPITTTIGSFAGTGTNKAELPRATPTRTQLTIDGTTYLETAATIQARINTIQAAGGNLNHKVRIADGQDVIVQLTVPARASGGTGWLQIESETLPCAFGTLARPAMFTTQATWSTQDNRAIIVAADPAGFVNLRLVGLHLRVPETNMTVKVDRLVQFWNDVGVTLAAQTRGFKMERCWLHGKVGTGQMGRALDLMGRDGAVFNCWFQDIAGWGGQEAQCILLGGGAGPFLVEDNYLEGAGELILSGGFDQGTPGLIPADMTLRRNHFNCPRSKYQFLVVVAKHLLETKTSRRWLVEGNVFENMWVGQETGPALMINSINQSGGAPWNGTLDLIVRKNFCRNAEAFVTIGGGTGETANRKVERYVFTDNVVPNISIEPNPAYIGAQRYFMIGGYDIEITHNTMLDGVNGCPRIITYLGANSAIRHIYRDNLGSGGYLYGVVADGSIAATAITFAAPGAVWHHNALVNFAASDPSTLAAMAAAGYTPNYYVPTNTGLGLTNTGITATWETADPDAVCAALVLAPGSPFRAGGATPASDGLDIGADITAVRSAISGVWTGVAPSTTAWLHQRRHRRGGQRA